MLLVVKLLEIISTRFNFSRRISIAVPNRHSVVANYYYHHHRRRLDRLDDVVSSIFFPVFVVPVHRDLSVSFNFLNYKTPTSNLVVLVVEVHLNAQKKFQRRAKAHKQIECSTKFNTIFLFYFTLKSQSLEVLNCLKTRKVELCVLPV